jgi:GNAT superfamily N-acetyltransferase
VRIKDAAREEMTLVLRASHTVWGEGMAVDDYVALHLALKESPWGQRHYRFLIGQDDGGGILSSMKLYTLRGRLEGREVRIAGVGAVFTPPERRGRGHATELVRQALEGARSGGHAIALLVSEIGEAYYARQGFRALPATEAACRTTLPAPWPKEPAWVAHGDPLREVRGLRRWGAADLDALVRIHDAATEGGRLAVLRDRSAWEQVLLKLELASRLPAGGEDLLWVIDRGEGVEAYAVLKETGDTLRWREHGARRGSEDVLVDLFWGALARARRLRMERLEGWHLPDAVTETALYPIARRKRKSPVVMARALDPEIELPDFAREEDCRLGELDAF